LLLLLLLLLVPHCALSGLICLHCRTHGHVYVDRLNRIRKKP
jgi:hypothetical protein